VAWEETVAAGAAEEVGEVEVGAAETPSWLDPAGAVTRERERERESRK